MNLAFALFPPTKHSRNKQNQRHLKIVQIQMETENKQTSQNTH